MSEGDEDVRDNRRSSEGDRKSRKYIYALGLKDRYNHLGSQLATTADDAEDVDKNSDGETSETLSRSHKRDAASDSFPLNGGFIKIELLGNDEIPFDSYQKELPNLDIKFAGLKLSQALDNYANTEFIHDSPILKSFGITPFEAVDGNFNDSPEMAKLALTEILGSLLNDILLALSADLQNALMTRITLMGNFWPNVADAIGIIAPTVFAHEFGQASPFKILLSEKVDKALKDIEACTDADKASIETVVLIRAHKEAICHA